MGTTALGVDGMQQGAKIRADPVNGGYVIAGSVWMDDQQGIVVKMNNDLSVAWSQDYGLNSGAGLMGSQGASTQGTSTTRCGECRWTQRATTCSWEDLETSILTALSPTDR